MSGMDVMGWDVAAGAALVAGIFVAWLGWRGRHLNDHPYCRRCHFDLVGLPASSTVCSECGASLGRRRATYQGLRQRRSGMLLGGLALLLPSAAWLALVAAGKTRSFDVNAIKPFVLLARDVRSDDAAVRDGATREVRRRLGTKQLKPQQARSLVDQILVRQADGTRAWAAEWGDLIEDVNGASLVSPEQWERYVANSREPSLKVRPVVGRGDPIPFEVELTGKRLGPSTRLELWSDLELTSFRIGGRTIRFIDHRAKGMGVSLNNGMMREDLLRPDDADWAALPTGPTTLTAELTVRHYDGPLASGRLVAQQTYAKTCQIRLVDETSKAVKFNPAENLRGGVEAALSLSPRPPGAVPTLTLGGGKSFTLSVVANNPPLALAYDVLLQWPQGEVLLGRFTCRAGGRDQRQFQRIVVYTPGFGESEGHIRFRPSLAAAAETLESRPDVAGHEVVWPVRLVEYSRRPRGPVASH